MAKFAFTFKEQTVRRHPVNFLMMQVRSVLDDKRVKGICMNNMPHDHGQLYTTQEACDIIRQVVDDSLYFAPRRYD